MKFYHGTSQENWEKIQAEGVLWGVRNAPSRCTYLAIKPEQAERFGAGVLLEVEYEPDNYRKDEVGNVHNHWGEGCWELRVYEPITLSKVRRIS